ncbi:helix-turn-helix domain-containing protein [Actinoplanes subglobosus]|uniref:Helix-turn-helix domain-containing protein n=1 Tax=Actinoplanes subglobosus TaxID=1547892 RepID=A0ABV8JD56_9ACTN
MTTALYATLLRDHRRKARMTQHELAVKSGVSVRAISDMERGVSAVPQRRTVDALADALGLAAADRSALARAALAARDVPSGVCALPRDLPDFTGRRAELALLTDSCRPGSVTVVHGPPGVGKTALAVHAAGRIAGRACFVDCRGSTPEPAGPDEVAERVARVGAPCDLLILDDVADPAGLPEPAGRAVVITGRRPLPGAGTVLRLRPFTAGESVDLLTAITGHPESPHAREVAGLCGHLPLALRVAGNRLAARPGSTMAALAGRLADPERRLALLSAGDLSVWRRYASAYAGLSPDVRRAVHLLASPGMETLAELGFVSELAHLFARSLASDPGEFPTP